MLDDLKLIHQRDGYDALGLAGKQWQQLDRTYAVTLSPAPAKVRQIDKIVVAAMGSSALPAELVRVWLSLPIPLEIVRNYDLPAYVGPNTLLIASSFSGNTEEVLSALAQAHVMGASIAVITAGGQLQTVARDRGYPLLALSANSQSRFVVWSGLLALLTVLQNFNVLPTNAQELAQSLPQQADWLATQLAAWAPTVPVKRNLAKQVALELLGKSVVVYAGPQVAPVAYRWKTSLNENAKQIAWCCQYPEFNHNEMTGWTKQPGVKPYAVIELRSSLDHARIRQRQILSAKLLSGLRPAPHIIELEGGDLLQQLLYGVALGDMASLYTAIAGGIDPTSQSLLDSFNRQLERTAFA